MTVKNCLCTNYQRHAIVENREKGGLVLSHDGIELILFLSFRLLLAFVEGADLFVKQRKLGSVPIDVCLTCLLDKRKLSLDLTRELICVVPERQVLNRKRQIKQQVHIGDH